MQRVWLSDDVLRWYAEGGIFSFVDEEKLHQPYEVWEHIQRRLEKQTTEYDRAEIIVSLRRVLDHREKSLNSIYKFRTIPGVSKRSPVLSIMVDFGLTMPVMTKKLIDLRNLVEHQHQPPPSHQVCAELSEFVWYFLKSTDYLVRNVLRHFTLYKSGMDDPYFLSVDMEAPAWSNIKFNGFVPSDYISHTSVDDWIEINLEKKLASRGELIKSDPNWNDDARKRHSQLEPNDYFIDAIVNTDSPKASDFVRMYFHVA